MTAMSGPRRIIDLPENQEEWTLKKHAVHFWKGKLWKLEKVGCALCTKDPDSETISDVVDDDCYCTVHGPLVKVPYFLERSYVIRIGKSERSGTEHEEDIMLFPVNMSEEDRDALIEQYLDEEPESDDGDEPEDDDE